MYIYTMQAMPEYKAKFDGDATARYKIKRTQTFASPRHKKNSTAVIRTDVGYTEATAMVKRFNDKERESLARDK